LVQTSQPVPALSRLTRNPSLTDESVASFVDDHTFPLQDGSRTTFVFRGAAESVRFQHWIDGSPNLQSFARHEAFDLWYLTLHLPESSRIEYKLEVTREEQRHLIHDPLNPLLAHDPFGANSVCYGPGYEIPDWTLPDPTVTAGTVQKITIDSGAFGDRREVAVYLPAGFDSQMTHAALIVHDGSDFVRFSELQTVLDNLIQRGTICPLVVALTDPVDRLREYAGDPRHARHLTEEILSLLRGGFGVSPRPAELGLMGASFGAVASLYTAWLYPRIFGRLLLQSGSFVVAGSGLEQLAPEFRPVLAFSQLFRTNPRAVCEKVYVSCGQFESLIHHNRELVPLFESAGMEVAFTETPDGHNWENWRDRLEEGLSFLFPGPAANHHQNGVEDE
jgi:enterochelin esterase family protein